MLIFACFWFEFGGVLRFVFVSAIAGFPVCFYFAWGWYNIDSRWVVLLADWGVLFVGCLLVGVFR